MMRGSPIIALILTVVLLGMQAGPVFAQPAFEDEQQHPVGAALAAHFSEITNYDTIMQIHEAGFGFGVIAQALLLTQKLDSDLDDFETPEQLFLAILQAKEEGDYSEFFAVGSVIPTNWGQFRKLIMDRHQNSSLGVVLSEKGKEHENNAGGNGTAQGNGNGGQGMGQGNGNGNGQGNHGNGNPDRNNDNGNNGDDENHGNGNNR